MSTVSSSNDPGINRQSPGEGQDQAYMVDRQRYFEQELTRLARMVLSQRQMYLTYRDQKADSFGFEPGRDYQDLQPFWTDPADLLNSFRADQRALLVLFHQALAEKIDIKDWLKQLVHKAMMDPPDRQQVVTEIREMMRDEKKRQLESGARKDLTDKTKDYKGRKTDLKERNLVKLEFARKYSKILYQIVKA